MKRSSTTVASSTTPASANSNGASTIDKVNLAIIVVSIILVLTIIGLGIALIVLAGQASSAGNFSWNILDDNKIFNRCSTDTDCKDRYCKNVPEGECTHGKCSEEGRCVSGDASVALKQKNDKNPITDEICQRTMCGTGASKSKNACCGVSQNGICVRGVKINEGHANEMCQTEVSQNQFLGAGTDTPNTYLITTENAFPNYGVTIPGNCLNVEDSLYF